MQSNGPHSASRLIGIVVKGRTDGGAECTEDGRIGAMEYAGRNGHGKGAEVRNEVRKKERCGTYNVGVKDLASAYVLCPRLAECGGLSIYGRNGFYGIMKGL